MFFFVNFLLAILKSLCTNIFFKIFDFFKQVNKLVPLIRNLFQSHRQILWGFTHSLISTKLMAQYTWSSRSKYCFENLKQIQGVLWFAMIKVSPTYTVQQLEDDFECNLAKCASQNKSNIASEGANMKKGIENETNHEISQVQPESLSEANK